jgi:hypothetical protein
MHTHVIQMHAKRARPPRCRPASRAGPHGRGRPAHAPAPLHPHRRRCLRPRRLFPAVRLARPSSRWHWTPPSRCGSRRPSRPPSCAVRAPPLPTPLLRTRSRKCRSRCVIYGVCRDLAHERFSSTPSRTATGRREVVGWLGRRGRARHACSGRRLQRRAGAGAGQGGRV